MSGPLTSQPSSTPISTRRAFLRRAGLGAAGLAIGGPALLAACSKSAAPARQVRVVNQPLAIDDNTPRLFEAATGVFLHYSEYTDPAAYLERVTARLRTHHDIGADVVVVPDLQAAEMIAAGFVRPLPSAPPTSLIVPPLANPRFDPGRRYSRPWTSAVVGLAYDRRQMHEAVTSAGALFDPRFAGKVVLSADAAATLGLVMLASRPRPGARHAGRRRGRAAACTRRTRGRAGPIACDHGVHRRSRLRSGVARHRAF